MYILYQLFWYLFSTTVINYFSLNLLIFKTTFFVNFFYNNRYNSLSYASCPLNDLSDKLLCIIFYFDVQYPWTLNLPIEKKSFLFMLKKVGKLPLINLHLQLFIMDIVYTWIYCQGKIFREFSLLIGTRKLKVTCVTS